MSVAPEHGRHSASLDIVREDFDRIAALPSGPADHGARLYPRLLEHVPRPCRSALDVGCGTGVFTRLLAARSERVLGVDLSPRMIEVARARSANDPQVEFCVADVMSADLAEESFDSVAAIAMLHHVPLKEGLARLASLVAPGGALLVIDLHSEFDWSQLPRSGVSWAVARWLAWHVRRPVPREVRDAWQAHGAHDRYPLMSEVRAACAELLPGSRVRPHLFWRWSLIWRRD